MIILKLIVVLLTLTFLESVVFAFVLGPLRAFTDGGFASGISTYRLFRMIFGLMFAAFIFKCIFELLFTTLAIYFSMDTDSVSLDDIISLRVLIILLLIVTANIFAYIDAGTSMGISIYFKVTLSYVFSIAFVYYTLKNHNDKLIMWINN